MEKLKFVFLTEKQQQQLLNYVRPSASNEFSYQNLNLAFGVYHSEKGFVLTLTYAMMDAIKRCDEPDDYTFALLFEDQTMSVNCVCGRQYQDYKLTCATPAGVTEEEVLEAIHFYYGDERSLFEEEYRNAHDGKSLYSLKQDAISELVLNAQREAESPLEIQMEKMSQPVKVRMIIGVVFFVCAILFLVAFAVFGFQEKVLLYLTIVSLLASTACFRLAARYM